MGLGLSLLTSLAMAWWAYHPGLAGGFLFDDFANLPAIGATGPVTHWATFWRYITSGTADPTGRPLTLLTFLIDARNWPASPYPFKVTNVILHLCNGLLLYALLVRLGRALDVDPKRARIAAWFGCSAWLLHPLMVSTTLYIVQREAMLPATWVMAGLLAWMRGREHLQRGQTRSGLAWILAGLGGGTLLGVLSKANGALLPVYALLIEWLLLAARKPLRGHPSWPWYRTVMLVVCGIPAAMIFGYLAWNGITGILAGGHVGNRPWSIAQRLLTEPRVLLDYLKLLWLPRPFTAGLFNDQFIASTSLLHPATTLPSLVGVLALIGVALWQRHKHRALALAILFYFAGQSIESSSIPLELYFEHRNYVPSLLMFWPLGLWLANWQTMRTVRITLLALIPLMLGGMTRIRTQVWGNVSSQALIWASINPASPRAQANAAEVEMAQGHPRIAARRLERLLASDPSQTQLAFNLIGARCMTPQGLRPGDLKATLTAMRTTANVGSLIAHWYERTLPVAIKGQCPGLTPQFLDALIDAGMQNPNLKSPGILQDMTYLRGLTALDLHQPTLALADFVKALNLQVRPGFALRAAATLGAHGQPLLGLRMLDAYERVKDKAMRPGLGMPMIHDWVLARQDYWADELIYLRRQLAKAAGARPMIKTPDASQRPVAADGPP